ncbi:helix-turn-helix domain-containing protein [Erwinia sp. CPCC 100877]|nr:helix-turn-helix domain-containing protein [Erwinia sp. CPCC 100877]
MIENFSKNVSRLRKEFGYSQEELAKKIDVNRQTISNIERGTRYPTFETLEKIAQVFKATPTQLFGTQKEIAVSDSPIILDRIDEYDTKIQNILKAENFINKVHADPEFYLDDNIQTILHAAQAIEKVTTYLSDPYKLTPEDIYNDPNIEAIFALASALKTIDENQN